MQGAGFRVQGSGFEAEGAVLPCDCVTCRSLESAGFMVCVIAFNTLGLDAEEEGAVDVLWGAQCSWICE